MPPHDSSQAVRSTSPRAAAAVAAAGVAILLLLSLAPPQRVLSRSGHGDVAEYFRYAQRTFDGQIPYRDFRLEYPPGALPVLLAAGPANHGYYNRFRILMLTLGAAAIVLLVAALFSAGANAAELAAGVLVPATLPLTLNPGLVIDRFDLWPTFLMLLAVVGLLRGRRLLSLVALGIGATAKVFPLALVPWHSFGGAVALTCGVTWLSPRRSHSRSSCRSRSSPRVASPTSAGCSCAAPCRSRAWVPRSYSPRTGSAFTSRRPTTASATRGISRGRPQGWSRSSARWRRRSRSSRCGFCSLAVAAAVVGFVAFGKIFSPQYMVWVAVAVPLALGRIRPFALTATLAATLLTLYVYDYGYFDLLAGGRTSWVMLARNLILVALFCSLLLELATPSRERVRGPADAGTTGDSEWP